jgi:hypothetical protein
VLPTDQIVAVEVEVRPEDRSADLTSWAYENMAELTFTVSPKAYPSPSWGASTGRALDPSKSFLLQDPEIELVGKLNGQPDVSRKLTSPQSTYSLTIDSAGLSSLEIRISYFLTVNRVRRRVFTATQAFAVQSTGSPVVPSGWKSEPTAMSSLRTDGRVDRPNVHPLLILSTDFLQISVDVCFVDITDLWLDLWKDVHRYKLWSTFFASGATSLRFLAMTVGEPLVWACAVPAKVANQRYVTPLVFYMPADFGDIDLPEPSVNALTSRAHESSPIMQFLLAPPDDSALDNEAKKTLGEASRNVVHHDGVGPQHWQINFGLIRAVERSNRPYMLLIPQRKSGGGNGLATSSLVPSMSRAAIYLMRSQNVRFSPTNQTPPQPSKMVLCGYSDSGVSLWSAAWTNAAHVKAVIGIEPQNLNRLTNSDISGVNKRGIDLLAKFVTEDKGQSDLAKRKFYLIGRHRAAYRPQFDAAGIKDEQSSGTLVRLPDASIHDAIFAYPPQDSASTPDFVRYRTFRLFHPTRDPLMTADERTKIQRVLGTKTGGDVANALFPASFNRDGGSGNWYSHNFAASGGQQLALPPEDPNNVFYGVAVQYKTFFQECLEDIRP